MQQIEQVAPITRTVFTFFIFNRYQHATYSECY
ncbi:hypothetical protein T07_13763 [Trichinella nelsoni]|uniref:Uncharacterized protein n=1 Tax=Trichinella nelsoni TaxID=6336 RepID=A0A0V0RB67_9BILA|nr:hypothetical protein T07_13763 [Trichinella nelsoni]